MLSLRTAARDHSAEQWRAYEIRLVERAAKEARIALMRAEDAAYERAAAEAEAARLEAERETEAANRREAKIREIRVCLGVGKIATIVTATADYYDVTVDEILSPKRAHRFVIPRHVAYYLAHELTLVSLPQIAVRMNKGDHTTILHGWRHVASLMRRDADFCHGVAELRDRLQ